MKSLGWIIVHGGERLWRATKTEARRLAQEIADHTGKDVTVREARAAPAAKTRKRTMRRNPDPGSFIHLFEQQVKHRQARADYGARTKATRLAKGLRKTGKSGAARPPAGARTAKYQVTAKRGREVLTLFRPSRSKADQLAGPLEAEGWRVTIQEA